MGKEAKILTAIAVLVAAGVSGLIIANSAKEAKPNNNGSNLVREDSHQTAKGAKVTVVEFGDFQCPACAQAEPTLQQLRKQYPQVNFVFRNFPLNQIHQNADSSSQAAEAAGAQGKYWEMHDKLYAGQSQWAESANAVSIFVTYAQQIGLDANKVKSEIEGKSYATIIQRDLEDGEALKVNSTPTFFVNGKQVESVNGLKAAIDEALKQ